MSGSFTTSSRLHASCAEVWARIIAFTGINDELMPLLKMTIPAALRGFTIANAAPGIPLFQSWLLLGGVLPVDFDALRLVSVTPPHGFTEDCNLLSMQRWHHARVLCPSQDGCTLTDTLGWEPRARVVGLLAPQAIGAPFGQHRGCLRVLLGLWPRPALLLLHRIFGAA